MHQPETLDQHLGVVVDGETGIAQLLAHPRTVPEFLVLSPPLGHRREAFTLVEGMLQVDVGEPDHPDLGYLDRGDPPPSESTTAEYRPTLGNGSFSRS